MTTNRGLKWLAVILPVAFWTVILVLRSALFGEARTLGGDLFALGVLAVGAVFFSNWVFGIVESREAEIRLRTEQLAALHDAALTLTMELDLGPVLQKVVDLSRELVHARYGALGVLEEKGDYIAQFITSGITPEERASLGEIPRGHGLLGVIIREGKPVRLPEIRRDPRSIGFPPNHPAMHSLLGVPVKSKGRVIGDLYLTDKIPENNPQGWTTFSLQDQQILEMFATQAAIAIENAQLYRQTQQLAVLQERERFGMDLHDGIIQSIYAIGLMLDDAQHRVEQEPQDAVEKVGRAIKDLNDVIRDIRNYILDLRPQRFQGRDFNRGLSELARDLRSNTFLNVNLEADQVEPGSLSAEQTVELLHIVQEALSNIRKHARASEVEIIVEQVDGRLALTIEDDGVGLNLANAERATGHGLRNMRERVRGLAGTFEVSPRENGGTRLSFVIPLTHNTA